MIRTADRTAAQSKNIVILTSGIIMRRDSEMGGARGRKRAAEPVAAASKKAKSDEDSMPDA